MQGKLENETLISIYTAKKKKKVLHSTNYRRTQLYLTCIMFTFIPSSLKQGIYIYLIIIVFVSRLLHKL